MNSIKQKWALAMLTCAALLPACAQKAATNKAAPAASAKAPESPLYAEIKQLAAACEVAVPASGLKCNAGEQRPVVAELAREESHVEALKTLTSALTDSDKKIETVAANLLHLAFRSSLGNNAKAGDVPPAVAKDLIDVVAKLPKPQASQALPAAVHAAMLSGQQEALYKMLEARSADKLSAVAYRYLMTHGRLGAFDKVKAAVASDQLDDALSAAASPASMRNWTDDESKQICDWASELLGDTRVGIATRAGTLLGHCSGDYVDKLLAKGEELLKAGNMNQAQVTPFRDVCSAPRRNGLGTTGPKVTDEQCARNRKFLEKVLATPAVDGRTKAMTLSAITYQWPDDQTKRLLQKFEKNSDKELAKHASDMLRRFDHPLPAAPTAKSGAPAKPAPPSASGSSPQ
ncbi:MAG TPA: hypothetical protein VL137_16650 [Polyangiaceae bacterium]|nr:hypothetical protein [Polyangiaceae bacterium]